MGTFLWEAFLLLVGHFALISFPQRSNGKAKQNPLPL
ncbi:hypothetical protein GLYMA_10G039551v4 [Glycine max]|nr:hypothetical protein GLYMA_10G039551v4 [Glycine max]KAH1136627.1 hypothetical protein GYH30_026896 [Glycine max]